MKTSSSIDDEIFALQFNCAPDAIESNRCWFGTFFASNYFDADALTPRAQLINRCCTESICSCQSDRITAFMKQRCQLCY